MSFNTFYLNSELSSGVIDGSNVIIGGNLGISTNNPQHNLDVSGTINTINLIASTATISELDISGETIKATSIQTKVESSEVVILDVNVSSKTSSAFNSSGSSNAYFINNIETPFIHFTSGKTYRFNQGDTTNSSHPIRFYLDEAKTSQYNTNITTNGTVNAGSLGDYVEITITSSTPQILYYQCQNHSFMGGKIYVKGTNVTSITSVGTLTAGTWNASTIQKQYLDTQNISVNDLSDISFNSTSTTNGQALVWDSTNKIWEPGTVASSGGGGLTDLSASSINDLSDVSFNSTSTTNGQALVWDSTNKIWEAGVVAGSGGGGLTDLSATSINDLSDVSLNGIQVNQTVKWDGEKLVPTTLATTDTKQGQVLETLTGVCDGRTVVVESGSYTLENVTTYQDIGSTYSKATGSGISYKPPVGTSQVIYRYYVYTRFKDGNSNSDKFCYKIKLDNTFITDSNKTYRNDRYTGEEICISYVINIGNNNISNGEILSWNTLKNIEVHVVDFNNTTEMYLHDLYYLDGNYLSLDSTIRKPRIEIVAIGESSGQAVTITNNSVNDLSDVSFNYTSTTNGQALVWNSTDNIWEAGTVASSGGVSSGDDISFNNLDISGVLGTNKSNNQIKLRSHIIPTTNANFDLGSAEYKIRHLFLSDNSLWIGDDHKIDISGGKMKFKKRKKNIVPTSIVNNGGTDSAALAFAGVGQLTDMKLHHWESYARTLTGLENYSVKDIFQTEISNDWDEDLEVGQETISASNRLNANLIHDGSISNTEYGYLNGVTSAIQTQLNAKQPIITTSVDISMNNLYVHGDISCNSTLEIDIINENTDASGVTIDSVLLKDNTVTAHTITAQNYKVGTVNFISASRQGNFRDLEVKNSSNSATILLVGDGGDISIDGTLSTDTISEKTSATGVTIDSVLLKDQNVTAHTISAQNYAVGGTNFISASRQGNFRDLEVKNSGNTETILLTGDGGHISINGTLSTDTISEKTDASGVTIDGVLLKDGSITATGTTQSAGDNTTQIATTAFVTTAVSNLVNGAPGALDTLSELASALDNSGNFATNVTNTLGSLQTQINTKQATITDGSLTIAKTNGLQGALDAKQATITDASLTIAKTNGLQSALDAKQATISSSARLNADLIHNGTISNTEYGYLNGVTSAIQTQLNAKQATITDGSLTIARTNGLQGALDAKSTIASPTFTGTPSAPTASSGTNTTQIATTAFVTTAVAAGGGGGGGSGSATTTKKGQVLEVLAGVCDGRSITVESGTYTLANVTQKQEISSDTTYEDLTGSNISYNPPSGTKQIIYKMLCHTARGNGGGSSYIGMAYRLFIDGTQCGQTKHINNYDYGDGYIEFEYVIDIGTNDMTNGKISSWTTNKTIKLMCIERSSSYDTALHISSYNSVYGESNSEIMKPHLEIVAIGESSGQAVTLTTNSINDLSDVSFNSTSTTNGQTFVWNSTDNIWEAGTVASSGSSIDETTDVSLNDLSVHGDISGSVSSFIKFGETQTTQTNNKLYSWVVDNSGTFDISHIGYQSSGSEGTHWPKSRQEHSNIFDNSNNIIIFGGKDSGNNHLSNIWEYNIGTNTYTKKVSTMQTEGSSGIKPDYSTDNTWLPYENLTAMGYPNERSDNRSLAAFDDKLYWLSDTELWVKDLTASVSNPSTAGNTNWSQVTGITGTAPNNGKRGSFFHYNYDGTDYLYYLHGVWDDDTSPESGDFNTYAYRFNISTKTWSLTSATNSTTNYKRMYAAYHVYDGYCFSYGGNVNGSNYSNTFVKTGLGGSGDKAFGYCTTLSPSVEGGNSITGRTYVSWAGQGQYMYVIGGRASNGNTQKCIFRFDCANTTYRQITSTSDSIVGKLHWEEGVATLYDNKIIMASSYNAGTSGATNYILSVDISTISNSYSLAYYPDGSNQTDASRRINTQANNSVGAAAAFVLYKNRWYFMFPYGTGINSDGSYSDSVDYSNGYGGGKSPYMWTYVFSDYNSIVEHNLINHTSNLHNDNMYIFGGKNSSNSYKNNLIKVLLTNYTYSSLTLSSSLPSIRDSHSSVILNDKMYIFGGWDGSTVNNETWEFDLSVDPPASTQKLSNVISSTNINLYGHSAVIYDNNMYIFGGYNGSTLYNNIYKYDITNNSWSLLNTNGTSPSARYYHTAIVTKDEMIVYGGKNTSNITIQDSYLFDFNNNTWYLLNNDVATTHTQTSTSIPNYSFGSKALHYNSGNDYKIYLYGGYNSQNTTLIGGNGIIHTSDISHNLTEYAIVESGNAFTFNTNSNGRVGIGRQNPTKKLDVGGDGIFSGTVTSNGSILTSDDRIKHNEERITNALSTISKITPKHYFKTPNKLYDSSHNFILNTNNEPVITSNHRLTINEDYTIETGIIAQEIQNIPELRFAIQNTIPLGIDYNSIHCTHIAATNELHQLVKTQQTEIEQQQQEIENLKLVNQDLNNQFNQFIQELQNIKQHLGI